MAYGGNKTQRIDITDKIDPRTTARAAQKGTLYRYIPESGDPELLIKLDDGYTTNWSSVGGGGGSETTLVDAVSTTDIDINAAPATIDGETYTKVLVKGQTAPSENGVYDFNGTGQPLTRSAGWDTAADFVPGKQVFVTSGADFPDTLWANALAVATLDTDPVFFVEISSADFMQRDYLNAKPASVVVTGDFSPVDGVNFKVVCNDTGSTPRTLTLPGGTDSLNFILSQAATNVAEYTIATTGGDLLDPNIQTIFDSNQPVSVTFIDGTWYAV